MPFEASVWEWVASCAEAYGWTVEQALAVTPRQAAKLTAAARRLARRSRGQRHGRSQFDRYVEEPWPDG